MNVKGKCIRYGNNIDTDVIIPARYLNTSDHNELAKHCMEDIDKDFSNKANYSNIIVAGSNFGCGSSREHAPVAIKASGIACVVAKSFARIFFRNSINIGLPILECEEVDKIDDSDELEIDFTKGEIINNTKNEKYKTQSFPEFMQNLIESGGLMQAMKKEIIYKIAVIKGDGIGPEIVNSSIRVMNKIAEKFGRKFEYEEVHMGGDAIDLFGDPLPDSELEKCLNSDSVLLGAVGGPKWDNVETSRRPEKGLLKLRKGLEVYANLRPAKIIPVLKNASPLKSERIENGLDIMVVRELTGGIYFGERGRTEKDAYDIERYSEDEIKRIAKIGFEMAKMRNKKLTSVDKANVLETSRLWRKTVDDMAKDFPNVEVKHMYVDNMAMQLAANPTQFDVVVTSNMFGDILSDLLAAVCGSIGILASASVGKTKLGLYEPIHGSAPDIAGKGIANPIATISSVAMMFDISFGLEEEARTIEKAIERVLEKGYRTADLYEEGANLIKVSTDEMADKIIEEIDTL